MRNLYSPYQTPRGCHDVPFIYLFDGNSLTNGTDVMDQLSMKVFSDADFYLRRIAGTQSVAEFFSYRNASSSYVWQQPFWTRGINAALGASNQGDIGVVPEKLYPGNSVIRFDLLTVNKALAVSGGTDWLAYIAFQGVKRFPYDVTEAPCPYTTRAAQYAITVGPVDWTRGNYKRFKIKINRGYDFELLRLQQLDLGQTTPASGGGIPTVATDRVGNFNYVLYDSNEYQMMSAPVPDSYIIDQTAPIFADPSPCPGVFPCPGVLYPATTQIVFDLYAVQSAPQGSIFQIVFDGVERIPV
jgi:hypothetical protein